MPLFQISLAEWSLHRSLYARKINHLDFGRIEKEEYGIDAIELVNRFFMNKARDKSHLSEFKKRADDLGVRILLIMCDDEGALGHAVERERKKAVENHYKWLEAATFFGCHSIRVNARSTGRRDEQRERLADGLRRLSEVAATLNLNVLVENHGGVSSDAGWLVSVIKKVALPNCGTLPDFGNFRISLLKEYDRYKGVAEMMPFAKGVSAKAQTFDKNGNETKTDYQRMMKIILDAGYRGYVGIEYSGLRMSEEKGIRATKRLLEKIRDVMGEH